MWWGVTTPKPPFPPALIRGVWHTPNVESTNNGSTSWQFYNSYFSLVDSRYNYDNDILKKNIYIIKFYMN